jgi:hypothetical protein
MILFIIIAGSRLLYSILTSETDGETIIGAGMAIIITTDTMTTDTITIREIIITVII